MMMKTRKMTAMAVSLSMAALLAIPALAAGPETETGTMIEGTTEAAPGASDNTLPSPFSIQEYGSGQALTDEQAVALALEHAGFTQDQVERQRTEYDQDDGLNVLEVEFYAGESEYDYTIDLDGGRIISASYDMSDRQQYSLPTLSTPLTDSEAAALVLEVLTDATEQDMWIEADRDDGRIYYEIDLLLGDVEYNFDIDASAGVMVSWEQELTKNCIYGGTGNSGTAGNGSYGNYNYAHHYEHDWHDWD